MNKNIDDRIEPNFKMNFGGTRDLMEGRANLLAARKSIHFVQVLREYHRIVFRSGEMDEDGDQQREVSTKVMSNVRLHQ
jgi:hypothetical protein